MKIFEITVVWSTEKELTEKKIGPRGIHSEKTRKNTLVKIFFVFKEVYENPWNNSSLISLRRRPHSKRSATQAIVWSTERKLTKKKKKMGPRGISLRKDTLFWKNLVRLFEWVKCPSDGTKMGNRFWICCWGRNLASIDVNYSFVSVFHSLVCLLTKMGSGFGYVVEEKILHRLMYFTASYQFVIA